MKRVILLICLVLSLPAFSAVAKHYSDAEVKARFSQRPFPEYPRWARARRLTGSGLFRLHVDECGRVTYVGILKTTGRKELDSLATTALLRWHGSPGPKWEVDMPITFTMDKNYQPHDPEHVRTYR
jgi:TonB family protein